MFGHYLSSDLYRVSKMKSGVVILVISLCLTMITGVILTRLNIEGILGISRSDFDTMYEEQDDSFSDSLDSGFQMGFQAGVNAATDEEPEEIKLFDKGIYYDIDVPTMFASAISDSSVIIMAAIFTGLFFGGEFSTAYIKNFINANNRRSVWYLSKFTTLAIVTLIYELMIYIFSIITCALFSEGLKLNMDKSAVIYMVVQWLLLYAFCCVVACITIVSRSKAAGITVGVILGASLFTVALALIDLIIGAKFDVPADFHVSNYTITSNMSSLTMNTDGKTVIRAIIVAVVYGAVSNIVAWLTFRKRDIV